MRDEHRLGTIIGDIVKETRRQDEEWPWPRDAGHMECFTEDADLVLWTVFKLRALEGDAREELRRGKVTWAGILAEELGEAFNAKTLEEVRAELVQVGAVVVSMIQAIDESPKG